MKCILLQGAPGIGKTTLIKKVVENINKSGITADGFFTEEVKVGRGRIGFDIVTLKNERGILARKGSPNNSAIKLPQVGQYTVYLNDFEKLALPVFNNPNAILIIDEIGKMELFSKKFETAVRSIMKNDKIKVIATVPLKGGPYLVKELKENQNIKLITVDENNRNKLLEQIVKEISAQ